MINALLVAVSEEQLRSNLREDLPLVILGSIIAAIGVAAVVVQLSRWQSGERVLLWFGLFAGPYGLRLLTNTISFQMAIGEPQRFWPFVSRLVEFATIVPALLLFEDFYGKGWRSSVRWLIWIYVVFATIAFANIVIQSRPDLFPTAGIGTVFLLPAILLLGRLMGYKPPHVQDQGILSLGLFALFLTFAHDRIASTRLVDWHADTEPYGASGYANSELDPAAHEPRDGEFPPRCPVCAYDGSSGRFLRFSGVSARLLRNRGGRCYWAWGTGSAGGLDGKSGGVCSHGCWSRAWQGHRGVELHTLSPSAGAIRDGSVCVS